jgi:hypothetical protein
MAVLQFPLRLPDRTVVRLEVLFIALEDESNVNAMRSLEVGMFVLAEATELSEVILRIAVQRVGRYPSVKDGVACAEPGVVLDCNLPDERHWLYKKFEKGEPAPEVELPDGRTVVPSIGFFKQQAAVICTNFDEADRGEATPVFRINPDAENLHNLPPDYYANQLTTLSWLEIKSYLLMLWIAVSSGKLVHLESSETVHVGRIRTEPVRGDNVLIGIDTSGLHPGAVFGQAQAGRLVALDEAYGEEIAFEAFVQSVLLPLITKRYAGCRLLAICDPSNPRDTRTGVTPVQRLQRYQIRAQPAVTNRFKLRKEVSRVCSIAARAR